MNNKLAAVSLRNLPPGMHADGGGLWFQVSQNGRGRSWIFRYTFGGRQREMGLGSLENVGLALARQAAAKCWELVHPTDPTLLPVDPIEYRKGLKVAANVEPNRVVTFKECADDYILAHRPSWGSAKHAKQWESTLATYVYPTLGDLPVDAVDVGSVLQVLQPIWNTKTVTASLLRGRIESVLDFAKVQKLRLGENPARWRGHLEHILARPSAIAPVVHFPALNYSGVGAFMKVLRQQSSIAARALEFTVLTTMRIGAVYPAEWDEMDLLDRVWTVPATRMKGKKGRRREHKVPLSLRALTIVKEMGDLRENEFVFPGKKQGKPVSGDTMRKLLRRIGYAETIHGFRSTFEDWAYECTNFQPTVVEMAQAHTIHSAVERAYRRGDLFEKRRQLMDEWASYCDQKADP